ncbi:alpha/beta hydrolase [Litorimonas taeanensis]|uniref:alpha/beta hydrolase n=1 Tax=Litorimonas taeanensis TaxID=568099 RepID=UPI00147312C5|nr:alpha/beta fold hydrolase [Litorimonas taeanensis]
MTADYQSQVDKFSVPSMPQDWVWKTFDTSDGTQLRWGETGNQGAADTSLILIPGYTATLSMYGEHIDLLAERGFHVIGLDLRGQGGSDRHFKSQPEKLWVDDFSIYSDDVADFIKSQNFNQEQTIIPLGISFGGHVALRLAGDHPGLVDGLALLAPAIEPKAGEMEFNKALKLMNFMRSIGQSKRYVFGGGNWKPVGEDYTVAGIELCSSNPKRLYLRDAVFTNRPNERVGDVTNQWGAEFFESSLYIREEGYLESIRVPIYIASAEIDSFVSNATNQMACQDRLPHCRAVTYPGTGHCLPQESNAVVFSIFQEIETLAESIKGK